MSGLKSLTESNRFELGERMNNKNYFEKFIILYLFEIHLMRCEKMH